MNGIPTQIRTLDPLVKRQWNTVNKTYSVLFHTLDVQEGESIKDALYRPLKGETFHDVIGHVDYESGGDVYRIPVIDNVNYAKGGIYFDYETMEDTELRVEYEDADTINVSPGRAMLFNMYLELPDSNDIDISNVDNYLLEESVPTNITVAVLLGFLSFDSTSLEPNYTEAQIGLIDVNKYNDWLEEETVSEFQRASLLLGFITLDGSGQIPNEDAIDTMYVDSLIFLQRDLFGEQIDFSTLNAGVVTSDGLQNDW